jgi:glycosyltransferase involved in cell wall biosynthesis
MPNLLNQSPPNLRWLGFLKGPALDNCYRASRVLVCPYRWFEGFPNVVTHAMALRKPVVASRIGVLPEIVEDGRTGLLFETPNIPDLTQKIRLLAADPALCARLGDAGREKALRLYSSETVGRQLMNICGRALRAREYPFLVTGRQSASH